MFKQLIDFIFEDAFNYPHRPNLNEEEINNQTQLNRSNESSLSQFSLQQPNRVSFTQLRKSIKTNQPNQSLLNQSNESNIIDKSSLMKIRPMNDKSELMKVNSEKKPMNQYKSREEIVNRMKDIYSVLSKERREDILDLLIPSHKCFDQSIENRIDVLNDEISKMRERMNKMRVRVQMKKKTSFE